MGILQNGDVGDWYSMANGNSSCHRLALAFFKRWHIADIKNIAGDDQATLTVYRNSTNIAHTFRFYVYKIATDAPQLMAASWDSSHGTQLTSKQCWRWSGNTKDRSKFRKLPKFTPMRSSKASQKHLLSAQTPSIWCQNCAMFFLLSLAMAFVLTYEK